MQTGDWLFKTFGPESGSLDLGGDHWAKKWTYYGSEVWAGCNILHPKGPTVSGAYADSEWCLGSVAFDIPEAEHDHKSVVWRVESLDPLTISPSLLCNCGDHGFIQQGRWVGA